MWKWILGGVAVFVILVILLIVGSYAFRWYTLPFQGRLQERAMIEGSGPRRLQEYEQFYRYIEDFETAEGNFKASYNRPLSSIKELAECRALIAEMNENVNEYNRDSRKYRTSAKFKDPSLPDLLTKPDYTCQAVS